MRRPEGVATVEHGAAPGEPPLRVLMLVDHYLPGSLGGGPIRSAANLVARLGDEVEFRIITRDRDLGDSGPYPGVESEAWQQVGRSRVFYVPPRRLGLRRLWSLLREEEHDLLYLNSFFSPRLSLAALLLRRAGVLRRTPLLIAPRGEFSEGALGLKPIKKRFFLWLARASGLARDASWHASTEHEAADIERVMGSAAARRTLVAGNLPAIATRADAAPVRPAKEPGHLRLVFLSRITPKKNLLAVVRALRGVSGQVELDVYGPVEDAAYWERCRREAMALPGGIRFTYRGAVAHEEVSRLLGAYHLFILPTLGENFGHVILEALAAGCPVLISDQTAWRGLERAGAGWDLPLGDTGAWTEVLEGCVAMGDDAHAVLAAGAKGYADAFMRDDDLVERNCRILVRAAGREPARAS